jgi:hypothetical protein
MKWPVSFVLTPESDRQIRQRKPASMVITLALSLLILLALLILVRWYTS